MIKNIINMIYTDFGKYIISILLGIGLSSLFRKACKNRNCMDFKAPQLVELNEKKYKYDNKCYKLKSEAIKCDKNKKQLLFA
tara:strand:+ start:39 stop:284 length:246 start_codon:yes stop_codon:yes gene_type:complete